MLASAVTFTVDGVGAREVRVEVDVNSGLPAFAIVGLPDPAVREARERVRAAVANSGFEFPQQRITVNLAPASLRKAGPGLDLAIAAALLAASGALPPGRLDELALAGELALTGAVRPVAGVLAMAEQARAAGLEMLAVAAANGPEAALVRGLRVVPVERLDQLAGFARGEWEPPRPAPLPAAPAAPDGADLADLRGQPALRHALEVTAAGGHNLLMIGPPGAGKSLAARRIASLLPPLAPEEALEVARIASVCGRLGAAVPSQRPFRAPHHTVSHAGLVGGGNPPRAGEATLAHRGVLFLDEVGEFRRSALEALRVPLEEGRVTIVRAGRELALPCRFMLVAAANPCPCGPGAESDGCSCSPAAIRRYEARLSGALIDRVDIRAAVSRPDARRMHDGEPEGSAAVRARVFAARERQARRLGAGRCNADLTAAEVRSLDLAPAARDELVAHAERGRLSGRAHDRLLRVARTLADLDAATRIEPPHVAGALTLHNRGT